MEYFLGEIILFGGNFDIRGFASCSGQLMSIAQNTALFSLLGTQYGGDGVTTFALPDLRGRVPVGQGQGPGLSQYIIGEKAGTETATLTTSNMPSHTHPLTISGSITVSDVTAGSDEPANSFLTTTSGNFYAASGKPGQNLGGFAVSGSVGPAGNNAPFSILQPFLVINYQIALEGVYPSRN